MSASVIVDASVAVKWLAKEEDVESALFLLERAEEIHAPKILLGEVANAIWKKVRRQDLTVETGDEALRLLPNYLTATFEVDHLMSAAFQMACAHDHPVYDCLYLAGAAQFDLPLVTADARLVRKFARTRLARHIIPLSQWRP